MLPEPVEGPSTSSRRWPVFNSLQGYQGSWLRSDLIAELTVWAVLVPQSLAYASIAGLPPVAGLYAAVWVFGLDEKGVKIVGHIDSGLPAFGLPAGVGWRDYLLLFGPAIGVLLIGFAEGLGAAKTYATKAGYEGRPTVSSPG